jgi:hypothetical protein
MCVGEKRHSKTVCITVYISVWGERGEKGSKSYIFAEPKLVRRLRYTRSYPHRSGS